MSDESTSETSQDQDEPEVVESPEEESANQPEPASEEESAEVEAIALPELKQVIGALLFSSQTPLSIKQIANVFRRAADGEEEIAQNYKGVTTKHVSEALAELTEEMNAAKFGMRVAEGNAGFRFQNDKGCGAWIRQLLEKGRVKRLSKSALETLAIVAYRQPCTRSDVEAIRGVSVDGMVRNLLEMQLVKVVGRSELPGRPWLFGTTQLFMEHFGLKDLEDLPGIQELRRQVIAEPAEEPGEDEVQGELPIDEEAEEEDADEVENDDLAEQEALDDDASDQQTEDEAVPEDLEPDPSEETAEEE